MGMYMYPIKINKTPEKVYYEKTFKLNDLELSIKELKKYVSKEQTFQIDSDECEIHVYGNRFETKKELNRRVLKEESYMKRYNEYHAKKLNK